MHILVAGLINLETTLRVERFPIDYAPCRFPFHGVRTAVSGVGLNVALALHRLGAEVDLVSMLGDDVPGRSCRQEIVAMGLSTALVTTSLPETPQSVILYDDHGRRAIHCDLKAIQQTPHPASTEIQARIPGCRLAVLCNIEFARPWLAIARAAGVPVATDLHAVSSLDDPYNRDYMQQADIVFASHEHLPLPPARWAEEVFARGRAAVVGVGMGADGALLATRADRRCRQWPAVSPRPVVNSIGGGDALFSTFVHFWSRGSDPDEAMRLAVWAAGWKVGARNASEGLLDARSLALIAGPGPDPVEHPPLMMAEPVPDAGFLDGGRRVR